MVVNLCFSEQYMAERFAIKESITLFFLSTETCTFLWSFFIETSEDSNLCVLNILPGTYRFTTVNCRALSDG